MCSAIHGTPEQDVNGINAIPMYSTYLIPSFRLKLNNKQTG